MRQTPYTGITGFTASEEVTQVLEHVSRAAGRDCFTDRRIMVGVLASSKTLAGKINKWPQRYPPVGKIHTIFGCQPEVINLIHYSLDDPTLLYEDLVSVTELGGPYVDGVQLNIAWPPPDTLARYRNHSESSSKRQRHQPIRIVLQIGKSALVRADHDPSTITKMLKAYVEKEAITDVLLDTSGGSGILFDPTMAQRALRAIQERYPTLGIGVAGGLWEQSLEFLRPLVEDFPFLNLDAEGKLRDPSSDALDRDKAVRYIVSSLEILS